MSTLFDGNVLDQNKIPVPGAQVYIYASDGQLASLVDELGQSITQPVVAGEDGYWSAFVEDEGYYTFRYFWGGRERLISANEIAGRSPLQVVEQSLEAVRLSAAYAESMTGPTYASTAAGLAETFDGQGFAVDNGDGTVTVYINDAGSAAEQRKLATTDFLASVNGAGAVGFKAPGTGAKPRTAEEKFAETVSVGDYDTVAQAVDRAFTQGADLFWPNGTWTAASTVPNFHNVRHTGPGALSTGSTTFYPGIKSGQINTIYVSTTGNDANDGLASGARAFRTLQAALNALGLYGPVLEGKWFVQIAAGTYTGEDVEFPAGLTSKKMVSIYGPDVGGHPNVPTAIFNGSGAGSNGTGIALFADARVEAKDIKFINYGASAISVYKGYLSTRNIHADNTDYGITAFEAQFYCSGGIINVPTGGYSGIRSMFHTLHNVGVYYDEENGFGITGDPVIINGATNATRGFFAQEHATGHIAVTVNNCNKGVEVVSCSRVHLERSTITNCPTGVEIEHGCEVFDNPTLTNTFSGNARNWFFAGGVEKVAYINAPIECRVAQDLTTRNLTGTTVETKIGNTLYTIPGSQFDNNLSSIRVRVTGTFTGTAGDKQLRLFIKNFAGPVVQFVATASGGFVAELEWKQSGPAANKYSGWGIAGGLSSVAGVSDASVIANGIRQLVGSASDVELYAKLGSSADIITIETVEVWRTG